MKPILVLIGRPNVGKSTLFNRLTRTRDALVADFPGLTRDRHYGIGKAGKTTFLVVDTGGLNPDAKDSIFIKMAQQTNAAIAEADAILFLTDAREGLTAYDRRIADELRPLGRPVHLIVNKAEGMLSDVAAAEFHELGFGEPKVISAAHGQGVGDLLESVLNPFGGGNEEDDAISAHPKVAIVGKPNVGKSTLTNALLGEDRVIVHDKAGTTRDSIQIEFEHAGRHYKLIDTAGIRRKGKVFESIEKFSVIKTLQSIESANVVILVLNASEEISEQDAHIAGYVLERGRALVVAVNKWDLAENYQRELTKRTLARSYDSYRIHVSTIFLRRDVRGSKLYFNRYIERMTLQHVNYPRLALPELCWGPYRGNNLQEMASPDRSCDLHIRGAEVHPLS